MIDTHANSRSRANHRLYLAKIVLAAWRSALERQQVPAHTLAQAFEGGVREHLVAAYGWFLLAVSQVAALPDRPPRGCEELPPVPAGRVAPGEINEFRRLETSGWLGELLRARDTHTPRPRRNENLAVDAGDQPALEQAERWLHQLEAVFERMGNSLDEC